MNHDLIKIAEHIHIEWNDALANSDFEKILKLYAIDAVIESPLIPHLLNQESGIVQRGTEEFTKFFRLVEERKPAARKFYKNKYFTDGKTLIWEYPHLTPSGEQMDFVEIMEIHNGLIQYHRVYWGWYGFNVIKNNNYHK